MSKKKVRKSPTHKSTQAKSRRPGKAVMVVFLALALSLVGIIVAQWRSSYRAINPIAPLQTPSPTPQLSKEYIYADGKLVSIEEPGSAPLAAPASLTASGDNLPSARVSLSWPASASSGVDHYQVERCANITVTPSCYSVVAANVPAVGTTITYNDNLTGGNGVTAYLYRVRAVNAASTGFSDYTVDLATTITFTDTELTPGQTPIRAAHLNELRRAVEAVRVLAGLGQAAWTYPDPVSDPPQQRRVIQWKDVDDLRSQLDAALTLLGLSQPYPANPPLASGAPVKAAHFTQIRDRVR